MTGELHGTNAGGGRNEDYCKYCFKDGAFTFQGSMEEMIGAPTLSSVIPKVRTISAWPSADAPPWLPIAGINSYMSIVNFGIGS